MSSSHKREKSTSDDREDSVSLSLSSVASEDFELEEDNSEFQELASEIAALTSSESVEDTARRIRAFDKIRKTNPDAQFTDPGHPLLLRLVKLGMQADSEKLEELKAELKKQVEALADLVKAELAKVAKTTQLSAASSQTKQEAIMVPVFLTVKELNAPQKGKTSAAGFFVAAAVAAPIPKVSMPKVDVFEKTKQEVLVKLENYIKELQAFVKGGYGYTPARKATADTLKTALEDSRAQIIKPELTMQNLKDEIGNIMKNFTGFTDELETEQQQKQPIANTGPILLQNTSTKPIEKGLVGTLFSKMGKKSILDTYNDYVVPKNNKQSGREFFDARRQLLELELKRAKQQAADEVRPMTPPGKQ